jgi:Tfp pilus assembly protein PilW
MATNTLYEVRSGTSTTTDAATQTPLVTFNTATGAPGGTALNNCTIFIVANVAGFDTTGNTAAGALVSANFKVVSGTLSKVSTTNQTSGMIQDTSGTPVADFSVSGTTITFYTTGVAAQTIKWFGRLEITVYQPT